MAIVKIVLILASLAIAVFIIILISAIVREAVKYIKDRPYIGQRRIIYREDPFCEDKTTEIKVIDIKKNSNGSKYVLYKADGITKHLSTLEYVIKDISKPCKVNKSKKGGKNA